MFDVWVVSDIGAHIRTDIRRTHGNAQMVRRLNPMMGETMRAMRLLVRICSGDVYCATISFIPGLKLGNIEPVTNLPDRKKRAISGLAATNALPGRILCCLYRRLRLPGRVSDTMGQAPADAARSARRVFSVVPPFGTLYRYMRDMLARASSQRGRADSPRRMGLM